MFVMNGIRIAALTLSHRLLFTYLYLCESTVLTLDFAMLCDRFDTKCTSIKQCFNEFLALSDAIKLHLMYHKFHPLSQQNQNEKLIDKVKILSIKGM